MQTPDNVALSDIYVGPKCDEVARAGSGGRGWTGSSQAGVKVKATS